jgi:hypothetical protein
MSDRVLVVMEMVKLRYERQLVLGVRQPHGHSGRHGVHHESIRLQELRR